MTLYLPTYTYVHVFKIACMHVFIYLHFLFFPFCFFLLYDRAAFITFVRLRHLTLGAMNIALKKFKRLNDHPQIMYHNYGGFQICFKYNLQDIVVILEVTVEVCSKFITGYY